MKPDIKGLNDALMPEANSIKEKMEKLMQKYNFKLDFAFPEIKQEEIFGEKSESSEN